MSMRKIVVTEFLSLDGVFEAPGSDGSGYKYAGWTFAYEDPEAMKLKFEELMAADAQLLGRITYEGFAKVWPERSGDEFSDKFNSMPKYVVSKTLKSADWNNSHVISDNVVGEIQKLKDQEGKDILVSGSGALVRFLMENKLVDQFNFLVYPVVLGEGKRLFEKAQKTELKIIESQAFSSGIVKLIYVPKY